MLANDSGKNLVEFIQLFKKLSPDLQSYVLQQINDMLEKQNTKLMEEGLPTGAGITETKATLLQ